MFVSQRLVSLPSHYEHKIQKCIINPSDSHQHQLPSNNINTQSRENVMRLVKMITEWKLFDLLPNDFDSNCERFERRSHFISWLSIIDRVNIVLNRTDVDSD